ncbi:MULTISPECIES: PLD nuclease N-terminal domain-containing protein [unclassified Streptomyces]|uniref:PLD nuclease N-terminal domain-containing protein n=2 Tax=Streptomyces TaxID=1883 RepID=UPI002259C5F1|nr:PLD nuclease N-terminal domain-containing protein [Streptomyces sp. NBC_01296]WSN53298.1 PLD nuclease N-terminal domain-containing protein [Streptomyces sp. NBC_01296]
MNALSALQPDHLQAMGNTGRLVLAGGAMTTALAAALAALLLAVATLLSVLRSRHCNAMKALWVAIVLAAPFLGSLAWLTLGRRAGEHRTASH